MSWIAIGVIGGVIAGGVVVALIFTAAVHFAIGRGLGW